MITFKNKNSAINFKIDDKKLYNKKINLFLISNKMNKYENELDKILLDVLSASKEINIKLWLEAGTLLGCEQQNNYIPWEKDLDLGVWDKDLKKIYFI